MAFSGVNEFTAAGVEYGFWAVVNNSVPYGTTGSLSNGSSEGMGRLKGISGVSVTRPAVQRVTVSGDNKPLSTFLFQPAESFSGNITTRVANDNFSAKANGQLIETIGEWDVLGIGPACYNFPQLMFVLNCPAKSQETASLNQQGWVVYILLNVQVESNELPAMNERAASDFINNLSLDTSSKMAWGESWTTLSNGSTAYVAQRFSSPYPVVGKTFIGDGSEDTVVLNEQLAVASANGVGVWRAGTKLAYTTAYTASTSTNEVTFASAPAAATENVIFHQFVPSC